MTIFKIALLQIAPTGSHVNITKELQVAIAVTYIKQGSDGPTNNLLLIDQYGNIILEYAKVHICDFKPDGIEQNFEGC